MNAVDIELEEAAIPVAECPVCNRCFRPRSLSRAWDSVRAHVSARSRQGCWAHRQLHDAIHKRGTRRQAGCPACPDVFECFSDACLHLHSSNDIAHTRYRVNDEPWHDSTRNDPNVGIRSNVRIDGRPPSSHMENASASGSDNAAAALDQGQEMYGLAKAGDEAGVRALLDSGIDPNLGGEDGYTPLMTAAESGHSSVVSVLANRHDCNLNVQNSYGQTALALAAQNGHRRAVQELLMARGGAVDAEALCGGATAAELARRAGHAILADEMAESARQNQLCMLIQALTTGSASGNFDSLRSRMDALSVAAGLDLAAAAEAAHDPDDIMDWKPLCSVCMDRDVEMALKPCFHACFCAVCAIAIQENGSMCPICRCRVNGTQPIYL